MNAAPGRTGGRPARLPASIRAAVLVEHGYQELEFWYPVLRLREAGAQVSVIGPSRDETYFSPLGYPVIPDDDIDAAAAAEFDVLVVPGGAAARRLGEADPVRRLIQAHLGRGKILAVLGAEGDHPALSGDSPGTHPAGAILSCPTPDDLPGLGQALLQACGAA